MSPSHNTAGTPPHRQAPIGRKSLAMGALVYLLWGFFPLYFVLLGPAESLEVIVNRALWGLASCIVLIAVSARWNRLKALLLDKQVLRRLTLSGILILVNWTVYVYAVQSGHTVDAALGYFINPLVTVALARFVLKEIITPTQVVAFGLGAVAVIVMIVGMGRLPWVSMVLPVTFGLYSLVKKDVARRVPPLEGMAIETGLVTPILLAYYAFLVATQQSSFHLLANDPATGSYEWVGHLLLLIGAGVITLIPLLLFARASRGLPLAVMGLLQFMTPVMQMLIGVLIFHEHMEPARWVASGIIWVALLLLSADWIRQLMQHRL